MSSGYPPEQIPNGYSPNDTPYTNGQSHGASMDGRQSEYPQSGLSSPYNQTYTEHHSEDASADPAAAAQYPQTQDVKFNHATTTSQDYAINASPTRAGQYPEYMQRPAYPDSTPRYNGAGAQGTAPGNMAHPTSPSDNHALHSHGAGEPHSNSDIPVDPSIAASNQGYPQHHYAPYPAPHDTTHYQPAANMYPQHQYGAPYPGAHALPYGHVPPPMSNQPQMVPAGARPPGGGHPLSTVYSFVPIPGTHQQKRPRRRYEEIERMYKCGWNGCEKAYGTLNHLNAHVTMQSHGIKRTPEEFKEIRKEWKQRKKEEDAARKADDDRQRGGQVPGHVDGHVVVDGVQPQAVRQLPPLGYAHASGEDSPQYVHPGTSIDGMPQYQGGQMGYNYPSSPYGANNNMYHPNENGSSGSGHSPS